MLSRRHFLAAPLASGAFLDIVSRGAKPDGITLSTRVIQSTIDNVSSKGGGAILIPPGRFLTGGLILKSNVRLWFEPGAVLLGSRDLNDYPITHPSFRSYTDNYTERSLLFAEDCDRISLDGPGVIDGQGAAFKGPYKVRPYLARFVSCRDITVTGITFRDSPMWVQHYLACDNVRISGITVQSYANANNDGIDIDCCSRVRISDCDIASGDDAIVLKSTAPRPCREVAVTNCTLTTRCNALKLGTETNGGFENIVFSNCTVYDTRLAGLALEIVDGGTLDRVTASNITMRNVGAPLFIRLGNRARSHMDGAPPQPPGRLRNVIVSNLQASGCSKMGCAISGLPGHPIENLTLSDLRLEFVGGGTPDEAARKIEELPDRYPEYSMFGTLPAYALFLRHVRNLRLHNLETRTLTPDARPNLIREDVLD